MAKLVVMYPQPKDPTHFAKYFRETHMPLVEKVPGIRHTSFGPATGPDGNAGAFWWVFIGTFDSVEAIGKALGSPEGEKVVADIPNYSPDHQPTIFFVESQDG